MGNWISKSAVMLAIGTFLAVGGGVLALLPFTLPAWVGIPIALSVGALALYWIWTDYRSRLDRRARHLADGFSDGDSVEVDCRALRVDRNFSPTFRAVSLRKTSAEEDNP